MKTAIKILFWPLLVYTLISCQSGQTSYVATDSLTVYAQNVEEEKIVFDDGVGEASVIRNFYILFDGSGSMSEPCADEQKITGAKTAITKFLEKVPDDVNLGLLIFGTEGNELGITEVVPIGSNNRDAFKQAIDQVVPTGGTPLENATDFGIQQLITQYKKQLGYGEYRLIIVTDGIANDPGKFEQSLVNSRKYPFIAIYGIGLCIEQNLLKTYALNYTDAHDYDQLTNALEKTLAETESFDPAEFDASDLLEAQTNDSLK